MNNTLRILLSTCVLFSVSAFVEVFATENDRPSKLTGMIISNEDFGYFFVANPAEKMTVEGLHEFVDQYAGTKVTHLFFCPNGMKSRFRSASREAIWDPVDGVEPKGKVERNTKLLHERGLDPYKIWIERCREKGISPWITMRMNDVHGVDKRESPGLAEFWRKNPEFWRVPHETKKNWFDRALNYAHPEVRDYQMAFVRELFERYDFDGLELDWMRFGHHLTPGKEYEEREILTRFVKEVRTLAREWEKKRGHAIRIGVRVPFHPEAAAKRGMDALQWAENGLIDLIVPTPFWETTDYDIPVELWQEKLDADRTGYSRFVALAPGFEEFSRPWPRGKRVKNNGTALLYGFAAAERYRGAENIYLFNFLYLFALQDPETFAYPWSNPEAKMYYEKDFRKIVEGGLDLPVLCNEARRHPVTYHDAVAGDISANIQLPRKTDKENAFTVQLGPKPTSGTLTLLVGLNRSPGVEDAVLEATLNGKDIHPLPDENDLKPFGPDVVRALRFDCPPDSARDGCNRIEIRQKSGSPQQVYWVELRTNPGKE